MSTSIRAPRSLDDWYLFINSVYIDRNFYRDPSSIFSHLVEIVGGLSLLASEKHKPDVDPTNYLPKAIAWWMALCGKVGVRSVEEMIWSKFPGVCSYCHRRPHEQHLCRQMKRTPPSPNWEELAALGQRNAAMRPQPLDGWLDMFTAIYPAADTEQYSATFARFSEELGELAEAIRVFPVAPGYFLSEAADLFAWTMHLHAIVSAKRDARSEPRMPTPQEALAQAYPAGCNDCNQRVCSCPPILPKTLGRIAHEVRTVGSPFASGGALLPTSEALALFSLGSREVIIAGRSVPVTEDLVRGIHELVSQLTVAIRQQGENAVTLHHDVLLTLLAVQRNSNAHRLTQAQLDELAGLLSSMPSDLKSTTLAFLTNVAAAPWAAALLHMLR